MGTNVKKTTFQENNFLPWFQDSFYTIRGKCHLLPNSCCQMFLPSEVAAWSSPGSDPQGLPAAWPSHSHFQNAGISTLFLVNKWKYRLQISGHIECLFPTFFVRIRNKWEVLQFLWLIQSFFNLFQVMCKWLENISLMVTCPKIDF